MSRRTADRCHLDSRPVAPSPSRRRHRTPPPGGARRREPQAGDRRWLGCLVMALSIVMFWGGLAVALVLVLR